MALDTSNNGTFLLTVSGLSDSLSNSREWRRPLFRGLPPTSFMGGVPWLSWAHMSMFSRLSTERQFEFFQLKVEFPVTASAWWRSPLHSIRTLRQTSAVYSGRILRISITDLQRSSLSSFVEQPFMMFSIEACWSIECSFTRMCLPFSVRVWWENKLCFRYALWILHAALTNASHRINASQSWILLVWYKTASMKLLITECDFDLTLPLCSLNSRNCRLTLSEIVAGINRLSLQLTEFRRHGKDNVNRHQPHRFIKSFIQISESKPTVGLYLSCINN